MKKIYLLLLPLLLWSGLKAQTGPEGQIVVGAQASLDKIGSCGFTELTVRFGNSFQIGGVFNGTFGYFKTNKEDPYSNYNRDLSFGISIANFHRGPRMDSFLWTNLGIQVSDNHGISDSGYEANQQNLSLYFWGGLRLSNPYGGWFADHQFTFEFLQPLDQGVINARYREDTLWNSTPFNKQRLRITLESTVKEINIYNVFYHDFQLKPFTFLEFGHETGAHRQFFGYGVGFSLGSYGDSYCELFKAKIFHRTNFSYVLGENISNYPAKWNVEVLINIHFNHKNK